MNKLLLFYYLLSFCLCGSLFAGDPISEFIINNLNSEEEHKAIRAIHILRDRIKPARNDKIRHAFAQLLVYQTPEPDIKEIPKERSLLAPGSVSSEAFKAVAYNPDLAADIEVRQKIAEALGARPITVMNVEVFYKIFEALEKQTKLAEAANVREAFAALLADTNTTPQYGNTHEIVRELAFPLIAKNPLLAKDGNVIEAVRNALIEGAKHPLHHPQNSLVLGPVFDVLRECPLVGRAPGLREAIETFRISMEEGCKRKKPAGRTGKSTGNKKTGTKRNAVPASCAKQKAKLEKDLRELSDSDFDNIHEELRRTLFPFFYPSYYE